MSGARDEFTRFTCSIIAVVLWFLPMFVVTKCKKGNYCQPLISVYLFGYDENGAKQFFARIALC